MRLAFGDQLRLEAAGAIARHRNPDLAILGQDRLRARPVPAVALAASGGIASLVAEMLGQLGAKRTLDQCLFELLEKTIGPRQILGLLIVSKQLIQQLRCNRRIGRHVSLLDKVNSQKPAYTFFLTPSESLMKGPRALRWMPRLRAKRTTFQERSRSARSAPAGQSRRSCSPLSGVFRSNHYVWWCPVTSKFKDPNHPFSRIKLSNENRLNDDQSPKIGERVQCTTRVRSVSSDWLVNKPTDPTRSGGRLGGKAWDGRLGKTIGADRERQNVHAISVRPARKPHGNRTGWLSSFLWAGNVWPPLQGRDGKRCTLARADPTGRRQLERTVEFIWLAAVSHDQPHILIDRSGGNRLPTKSFREHPHSLLQSPPRRPAYALPTRGGPPLMVNAASTCTF